MTAIPDKWTAFLLSACVPGAGQLAARSWTCLVWFAAAGLFVAGWMQVERLVGGGWIWQSGRASCRGGGEVAVVGVS